MQSEANAQRRGLRHVTVALLAGALIVSIGLLFDWRMREQRPHAVPVANVGTLANAEPTNRRRFHPVRVVPAQPAIRNAPFIAASTVHTQVSIDELVLGVVIGDEARAYPINMLTGPSREIINDTLGGKSIAATW